MNNETKKKLKKILGELSTPEENQELQKLDATKVKEIITFFNEQEQEHEDNLKKLLDSFGKYANASTKYSQNLSELFSGFTESLTKKLEELGGTITTSYVKNKPENVAGVYKDMINQLSAIDESIKKKPVPVWNWPQYAGVSVRNKNFANINPATEETLQSILSASLATSITSGRKEVNSAGSPETLKSSATPCSKVIIIAPLGNAGNVVVGGSNVVATPGSEKGTILMQGASVELDIDDVSKIYVDAVNSHDAVSFNYLL